MRGRTLAFWYRLVDPDEARRHVPAFIDMDADPIVRARFWDLEHDGLLGSAGADEPWRRIREAVVVFPASYGQVKGDYTTYMYADDAAYIAFGREVMGWPVRDGVIEVDPEPAGGLAAGVAFEASMQRAGQTVISARLTLTGTEEPPSDAGLPRWLSTKLMPDVSGPRAEVSQLVATGPERLERRIWAADASLEFGASTTDELHYLQPREIVAAQYWSELEATVGWGEVLAELGPEAWGD